MRVYKFIAVLILIGIAGVAMAALNQYGVSDIQKVTFNDPIKIGETLLPKGEYKIVHAMDGDTHIMLFTQQGVSNPAQARVKCQLVKLASKADRTQMLYTVDPGKTHILQELVFKGDTAKHVF